MGIKMWPPLLQQVVMVTPLPAILRPNAAGDETRILRQYPNSGEHWDKVDDVTPDEDATNVNMQWSSNATRRDLYNLSDLPGAGPVQVSEVRVYARWRRQGGYPYAIEFWIGIKTGGTEYWSPPFGDQSSTYVTRSYAWALNPNTSNKWTRAELDALQAGIQLEYYAGVGWGSYGICTQVYVKVS